MFYLAVARNDLCFYVYINRFTYLLTYINVKCTVMCVAGAD